MNISSRIKKDIRDYYIAKKYEGQTLTEADSKRIFQRRYVYSLTRKYLKFVHINNELHYKIQKCFLVDRKHILDFSNGDPKKGIWQFAEQHITGTDLYVCNEHTTPFWRVPQYGYKKDWVPPDIEERHINNRVKNYQQVLRYLKMTKENMTQIPVQLQLWTS